MGAVLCLGVAPWAPVRADGAATLVADAVGTGSCPVWAGPWPTLFSGTVAGVVNGKPFAGTFRGCVDSDPFYFECSSVAFEITGVNPRDQLEGEWDKERVVVERATDVFTGATSPGDSGTWLLTGDCNLFHGDMTFATGG